MRKDEANTSPQIMPDTTQSLTLTRQRHIAPGRTRLRGSVFAALRRDKTGGGTRQRKREAGGTPGGVSPCKESTRYSYLPILGT